MASTEDGGRREMDAITYGTAKGKESGSSKNQHERHERDKTLICEVVVMVLVIALAWLLLLLPIIFYHLPDEVYARKSTLEDDSNAFVENSTTASECSAAEPYPIEGGHCQRALKGILTSLNCDTGERPLVLRDSETTASVLIPALMLLSTSEECVSAAVPLLCLHLFGLCDSSGVSIQPTSGQCRNVRDSLCSAEWQEAMASFDLPNCDDFPEEQASCSGSGDGSGTIVSSGDLAPQNSSPPVLLPCREDFFRPEGSPFCVANCRTWSEFTRSVEVGTDVFIALSSIVGFLAGIAVLVLSVIRYKQIFTFPSIFIVYMTGNVLVITFLIIVSYFDRPSLYCSSESIETSVAEPTGYCVITGMAFSYIILQLAIWWLFHTSALLWKVGFPLHARSFQKSGKTKYINIACAVVGFAIPLVPIIAVMAHYRTEVNSTSEWVTGGLGFTMGRFPPLLCNGGDSTVIYYSLVLPINLLFFVGITELILLFALVHRQHGLFVEKKTIKSHFKIGTPERKILIALCFYALLLIFAIPALMLATRIGSLFSEALIEYFTCEAAGVNPNNPELCDPLIENFRAFSNPELTAVALVLIGLFPIVLLIYTVNFEELQQKWKKFRGKGSSSGSHSHTEMKSTASHQHTNGKSSSP